MLYMLANILGDKRVEIWEAKDTDVHFDIATKLVRQTVLGLY